MTQNSSPTGHSATYHIERLGKEVLLVRVPSKPVNGVPLPDGVFTFRPGDPQYDDWRKRFDAQERGE